MGAETSIIPYVSIQGTYKFLSRIIMNLKYRTFEGDLTATGLRFAIVVSRFNSFINCKCRYARAAWNAKFTKDLFGLVFMYFHVECPFA